MATKTKKISVMEKKKFIKQRLGGDPECARKALMLIYNNGQTACEKAHGGSVLEEVNGCGFSSSDSEFLSSLAEQFDKRGDLSERQEAALMRIMPRYWRQIMHMAEQQNLTDAIMRARVENDAREVNK